jgi:hypothetical protein
MAPTGGPILATRPPLAQARERPAGRRKIGKISAIGLPPSSSGRFCADPVPEFVGGACRRRVFAHRRSGDIVIGHGA